MYMNAARVTRKPRTEKMNALPPWERLRHAFLVGRPTEVKHTPLTAVTAAQDQLAKLDERKVAVGLPNTKTEVGIVVTFAPSMIQVFPVEGGDREAVQTAAAIASLPNPVIVGLVYVVADPDNVSNFEFWTKAFLRGREYEKLLVLAVVKQMERVKKAIQKGVQS
jgi:hypothetical protein